MIEILEPRIAPVTLAFSYNSTMFDSDLRVEMTVERIADNQVRTITTLSYAKWATPEDDPDNIQRP